VAADARGIPTYQPKSVRNSEALEMLASFEADLVVVTAYGKILPSAILTAAPLGCINVHASILPRYRGASPITQAIIAGDAQTGVSIMQLDEGMDTGAVHSQRAIPIAPDDTCATMSIKLAELGAKLLLDTLPAILSGESQPQGQDDTLATHAPLLSKEDGRLDFSQPASVLERRIRGYSPWPGAFTTFGEDRVLVAKATLADGSGEPGVIIGTSKRGIQVACGQSALLLEEVRPAGRKLMPAAAWSSGRGPKINDILGKPSAS
jgi:methionyl-tRNA formyltransferase